MEQYLGLWQSLDRRRRFIAAGAAAATFAAIVALAAIQARGPSMGLLYAGLEGKAAGAVVAALDQRAIPYDVRGSAIYVPVEQRDQTRMLLAGEGLPATGGMGYELLDSLSGFGTTSQMFDAAYWRAKEGELARTILSSPQIRAARVHIAATGGMGFGHGDAPSASITVTAAGGLTPAQAKALRYLVAAAVTGMQPERVSVIEASTGTLIGAEDPAPEDGSDRAREIRERVERLLEARVGYGNAAVEVSVDTETARESITERRFDPQGRVAISTDTEERSTSARDARPAAVTVASNLPAGDAGKGADSQSSNSETRERVNYEVSETTREVLRTPGQVRRLTVAVLVDGIDARDADGNPSWQPRPDSELAELRDLVASAVGYDEARGDVITLKSMQFEALTDPPGSAASGFLTRIAPDPSRTLQVLVSAIVALVLGLFVLRPLILSASRPAARGGLPAPGRTLGTPVLTGEIDEGDLPDPMRSRPEAPPPPSAALARIENEGDAALGRLRRLIAERQQETSAILRGWLDEPATERER